MKNIEILLNGKWNYILDSESSISYETAIAELITESEIMDIPQNWQLAGLNNFNGSVWFYKAVKLDDIQDVKNPILEFGGVDYFTDLWVNDKYIGRHEGYFQKFYFELSDVLKSNEDNIIVVKVTSPKEEPITVWPLKKQLIKGIFNHHDCRPGSWSYEHGQDKNTGGIWNDVKLQLNEFVYVENVKISSKLIDEKTARINVELKYLNKSSEALNDKIVFQTKLEKSIINKSVQDVILNVGSNTLNLVYDINNPQLWYTWDTGKANVYELKINSNYFTALTETFGIKEVKLESDKTFFLNGKKLFLRGTNIIPEQFLSSLSNKRIKKLVTLIKEANINAVRVHAHVNRKELYDEFDKQGIIIWQDFALQWTYEESPKFVANAVNQIKDLVRQNYNHPSIAIWCCHNEPGEQIKTVDPFLYDAVLSEDTSRIIRLASNYEEHPYDGWYWGKTEHYAAAPMGPLVTEFGAQAIPELKTLKRFMTDEEINTPCWDKWEYHDYQYETTNYIAKIDKGSDINTYINNSQNYQAELLKTATEFYRRKKNDGITGVFQFMFIDCWDSITWSIVDYYENKKKGYSELQRSYLPLILSVRVRQQEYLTNSYLNFDLWIINDLWQSFGNCNLVVETNNKKIVEFKNITVEENSNIFYDWEKFKSPIEKYFKVGINKVTVKLIQKNNCLADTEFEIKINDKKTLFNEK